MAHTPDVVEVPEPGEMMTRGRVTSPGRYAVLHDVADRLVHRLVETYLVTASEADPDLDRVEVERATRLQPDDPRQIPVVINWTAFPGVIVQSGAWQVDAYPACGCDACDELVDDAGERLIEDVETLIREGLREQRHGPPDAGVEVSRGPDGEHGRRSRSSGDSMAGVVEELGGPVVHSWHPWTPRP